MEPLRPPPPQAAQPSPASLPPLKMQPQAVSSPAANHHPSNAARPATPSIPNAGWSGSFSSANPGVVATGASQSTFSPTKPPYIPQFTAATQMILKRMRGESATLSSTLASTVATNRTPISPRAYEDVKRRLLSGMNTSSTLTFQSSSSPATSRTTIPPTPSTAMALPMPSTAPRPTAKMSAIQKVNAGLTASGKPARVSSTKRVNADVKSSSTSSNNKQSRATASSRQSGVKRKRNLEDAGDISSLTSLSDQESDQATPTASTPTTTTKSGRQVLKPTTYNPAAMDTTAKKRVHYGKRKPGEAMCKLCTRLAFTNSNQIVFCDGCDGAWHQRCHDPHIDATIITNSTAKWFCSACAAKREKQVPSKKPRIESPAAPQPPQPKFISWADRDAGDKRAYFNSLWSGDLVKMLMHALELEPTLAIFPNPKADAPSAPRSLFANSSTEGLFNRANANPNGPPSFVRRSETVGGIFLGTSTYSHAAIKKEEEEESLTGYTPFDPEEEDPYGLMKSWPKPGHGPHNKVLFGGDDLLVDKDDYEAFSHVVYDSNGRKTEENGMAV